MQDSNEIPSIIPDQEPAVEKVPQSICTPPAIQTNSSEDDDLATMICVLAAIL